MRISEKDITKLKPLDRIEFRQKIEEQNYKANNLYIGLNWFVNILALIVVLATILAAPHLDKFNALLLIERLFNILKYLVPIIILAKIWDTGLLIYLTKKKNEIISSYFKLTNKNE